MPRVTKTPVLIGLSLLSSLSLTVQAKPNFSAFAEHSKTTANSLVSDQRLMTDVNSISVETALGVPNFLWLKPSTSTNVSSAKSASKNLEAVARGHIAHYAKLYRLTTASLSSARLQEQQRLGDSALIRFNQVINGIEVFERHVNVLMDKHLALTAISGYLAPQQTVNTAVASTAFNLGLPEAISSALADLYAQAPAASAFKLSEQRGDYQWYVIADSAQAKLSYQLSQAVRGKKVYYPFITHLEPAYYLEISTKANDEDNKAYSYVISAQDGRLLARTDLTAHDAQPFSYRVWAEEATLPLPDDSPYGTELTPFPETAPTQAATPVAAKLIQLSCGPISTCDPWLPDTAVQTVGNNVDAYADISRSDGFSRHDIRAPLSADHTFDYAYDFSEYDSDNRPGQLYPVIVQAFYTTNFLHDWLYDHGFNEQAGNGQDQNYGRGGAEVDRMRVEINDFSGTDNANMATPADGESARMQLFLWSHNGAKHLAINTDDGLRKKYPVTTASFGPQDFKLKNQAIAIIDDGTEPTNDGCEASVSDTVSGKIALIDRGDCFFAEKVKNAQDAGAIGAIIVNNAPGNMLNMGGIGDPAIDNAITIPTLGITKAHGDVIKQQLTSTPTLTANLLRRILPPYNSALDNTIVVHEWGHFLSTRLVKRLANNQGGSMGEGWSDFLSLLVMVRPEDQQRANNTEFNGAYPVAQYVSATQPKDYFFGIRRYPYSTDMNVNPLTFKHITDGVALPGDIPTLFTAKSNAEVHNSGEVWATMLWEAYAQLLNDSSRLSPEQARDRMLDYLVASLKMTPTNPTFIEARNALLTVAQARDTADYNAFWRAFAKRGMGVNAKAPKRFSTDHLGAVEDFQLP